MRKNLRFCCILWLVSVLFGGCADAVVTDDDTQQEVATVAVHEGLLTIEHHLDNMDRGDHDFMTGYHSALVVDPLANDYKRGDVVYFAVPEKAEEMTISRIVALPGEEIAIKAGQVYIDGNELKTFYGREYHTGQWVEKSEVNLEKMRIPEGHYFVLGDNWWRSHDSKQFGPLAEEHIKGKVLGYKQSPSATR
ncbi:signal peptidase I [Brevibacillus marinus]|uniref:signal peptidase I n=1 Tax=Brevibacillus marinus TaxID=2496837 RepID=UPI000F818024|nr:signal peptidase I [Brevibacillus marinus]